jgi:hypothetical protein
MSKPSHRDLIPDHIYQSPLFLTVGEVAALLRLSPVTLGRWRIEGRGPPFLKFGKRVVYGHAEVVSWAHAQKRQNTSVPARRRRIRLVAP